MRPPWLESERSPSPVQKAELGSRRMSLRVARRAADKTTWAALPAVRTAMTSGKETFRGETHLRAKATNLPRSQSARSKIERGLWEEKINTPPGRSTRQHSRRHRDRFSFGTTESRPLKEKTIASKDASSKADKSDASPSRKSKHGNLFLQALIIASE